MAPLDFLLNYLTKFPGLIAIVVSGLPTWQDLPPSLHTGVREGSADILLSVYLTQYYLEKMELWLCILMDDGLYMTVC